MTAFIFVNYVDTTLAAAASSTATSLSLSSSANLPVLGPGEIMPLTLNDAATGLVYEIVYVTAISGTTLTILRGQEGTSAQNWSAGDYAFVAPTADTVAPVAGTHSPVASETLPAVNRLVVTPGTLTAAIDLTLNDQAAAGSSVTAFGSAAAYEVTVQSPVTSGSPYIELPDGSQVYSWVIPASSPTQGIHVDWDGTNWRARTFGQEVVAPATQNNAAVPYGQAFQYLGPTASETITLGNTLRTVVQPNITAAATITLEPGSVVGQEITVFGSAYALTVQSNVTSGNPFFYYADGSTNYSWTIGTNDTSQGITLVWDATNWRARTFGQEVVAPATQNNAAPQLSQLFIANRKAVFTANGTWTVPSYVSTIWVSGCAGGGGGGGGAAAVSGGNGGGAGQSTIKQAISVTGGHSLSITIGGGGANGGTGNTAGTAGGNTVLGDSTASTTLLTLAGGGGGNAGGGGSDTTNAANSAGASGYPAGGNGAIIDGYSCGGSGGSTPFGGGGAASWGNGQGTAQNASGYGSGGGGGGGAAAGGNGAPGFLVIEW